MPKKGDVVTIEWWYNEKPSSRDERAGPFFGFRDNGDAEVIGPDGRHYVGALVEKAKEDEAAPEEYHCTVCDTVIEQYDEVTLIQAATVTASGETGLCHSPSIEALCDPCSVRLDTLLVYLHGTTLKEVPNHD